jgi:hypothetical protein
MEAMAVAMERKQSWRKTVFSIIVAAMFCPSAINPTYAYLPNLVPPTQPEVKVQQKVPFSIVVLVHLETLLLTAVLNAFVLFGYWRHDNQKEFAR